MTIFVGHSKHCYGLEYKRLKFKMNFLFSYLYALKFEKC